MDTRIIVAALCLTAWGCGEQTTTLSSPSRLPPNTASTPGTGTRVAAPTSDAVTPVSGRLAFSSDRDGIRAIYVASGLDVRRLANGDRPKWSPNGTQLVFQETAPGVGIYIINADGSGQRFVTQGYGPSWSPDGSRLVFSYGDLSGSGLYVVNADGTNRTKIVDGLTLGASAEMGVWSPDGRTIAFIRANYDEPWQLHLVAPDGSSLRALTRSNGSIFTQDEPEWSSDGRQFVFGSAFNITISNADGSDWQTVAPGLSPDWIAGGVVYAKYTGPGPTTLGGWEHRIYATDGGAERQVIANVDTPRKYADLHPDWTR